MNQKENPTLSAESPTSLSHTAHNTAKHAPRFHLNLLREINRLMIRVHDKQTLFQAICNAFVNHGNYRMAWIGILDETIQKIVPVTSAGFIDHYLDNINIDLKNAQRSAGPTAMALREKMPFICQDIANDERMLPWRENALKRGYRSSAAFPIIVENQVDGVLSVYSSEVHAFDEECIELIKEICENLSFTIAFINQKEENQAVLEALSRSEERFRNLVNSTEDVIYTLDEKQRHTGVYGKWLEKANLTPEFFLGKTSREIFGAVGASVHEQANQRALAGEWVVYEWSIPSPEGEITYQTSLAPLHDAEGKISGIVGIGRNITPLKQAEAAQLKIQHELYRTKNFLENLIQYANAPIVVWNSNSNITLFNRAFERLTGYSREEVIGKNIEILFPTTTSQQSIQFIQHALDGEQWETLEIPILRKDGEIRIVLWNSANIYNEDKTALEGVIAQGVDITELRKLTDELKEKNTLLQAQKEELYAQNEELIAQEQALRAIESDLRKLSAELEQRVNERTKELSLANAALARAARMKDEFLASMSHELRTPLTAILGLSEALQQEVYGPLNEKQRSSLVSIEESGRHLLSLINDILDLSKIESGREELVFNTVKIESLCKACLQMIQQDARKKNLKVNLQLDPQFQFIYADERRLKQIIVNLLTNAVKFTPPEGSIGIEVSGDAQTKQARFTVWDTGIGIAKEDIGKLFQPFVQLDSRLSREYTGTGLGLALVSRLTEMHGGSIHLESELGKGSRFSVVLPWDVEKAQQCAFNEDFSTPSTSRLPFRHGLIIEDNEVCALQLKDYLRQLDIQSTVSYVGSNVLELVLSLKPDVILLDLILPDISGWEIIKTLKSDSQTKTIPIIVTTVIDDRKKAFQLGADAFISKPISFADIHRALALCAQKQQIHEKEILSHFQSGKNIPLVLIAEDNLISLQTISDYLSNIPYRIVTAINGSQAIEKALETRPDIILMDIQMPQMDGLEAIRRLRSMEAFQHTPIIAITALVMPGDRERCLAAGADDYMGKPLRLSELKQRMEKLLVKTPS